MKAYPSRFRQRDPLECEIHFYKTGSRTIRKRLTGNFSKALQRLERRYRDSAPPADNAEIIPLQRD